jgi:type IV secretory pathway VirB10-like protein
LPEPVVPDEPKPAPAKPEPIPEIKPAPAKDPAPVISIQAAKESCSDFAFPGYGNSGQQIGWIKPQGGSYLFHPFSDKDCNSPTGVYNPDNGIITDISNSGKKIGTDAEHIGYASITNGTLPQLSNPPEPKKVNRARELSSAELAGKTSGASGHVLTAPPPDKKMTSSGETIVSSMPYDRTFILRQYKPIPATIVSEIRADQRLLSGEHRLPVVATVDRNVYSDNGRTIIVPTGTTLYGYVTGDMPGPYKAIGRMHVQWYQFVRPDGVEFNFAGNDPFSGDAQGRVGVPGRGSTDYMEQFVMPMLTAIVPAAVNMIAPISDKFVNQIDLDNNTVTQTGQVRSSELAKNEIITAWNKVAQKLMVDMMDNTVPPFSIAAGTRITVFSPVDLQVTCGMPGSSDKKCAISEYGPNLRANWGHKDLSMAKTAENAGSMVGQVRSFNLGGYCDGKGGVSASADKIQQDGYDYRTVLFYCQSDQYKAINNAKQEAVYANQQQTTYVSNPTDGKATVGSKAYNEQVLGLNYNKDGTIKDAFKPAEKPAPVLTCLDGTTPDANGCCAGETYTDMGNQGFNCCPAGGGDCFPPIL